MTPGTILFDKDFKFFDGASAPKLLVLLNDGVSGYYIIVKLTSQRHEKGVQPGCQPKDRFQNFYLRQGAGGLPKDSWVMLNEFYEADLGQLLQLKLKGRLEHKGCLEESTLKALIVCAKESLDISDRHAAELDDCLNRLVFG